MLRNLLILAMFGLVVMANGAWADDDDWLTLRQETLELRRQVTELEGQVESLRHQLSMVSTERDRLRGLCRDNNIDTTDRGEGSEGGTTRRSDLSPQQRRERADRVAEQLYHRYAEHCAYVGGVCLFNNNNNRTRDLDCYELGCWGYVEGEIKDVFYGEAILVAYGDEDLYILTDEAGGSYFGSVASSSRAPQRRTPSSSPGMPGMMGSGGPMVAPIGGLEPMGVISLEVGDSFSGWVLITEANGYYVDPEGDERQVPWGEVFEWGMERGEFMDMLEDAKDLPARLRAYEQYREDAYEASWDEYEDDEVEYAPAEVSPAPERRPGITIHPAAGDEN
ncbi:MAG: hypothetical protein JW936_01490 [Sedimentisphaerales bacterium]|nr:hypothetical protein [Sedimentisphaerales bacterium]